jgi:hypothetical protein
VNAVAWDAAENSVTLVKGRTSSGEHCPGLNITGKFGTLMPRLGEDKAPCRNRLKLTPASVASWHVKGANPSGSGSGCGIFTGPWSQTCNLPAGVIHRLTPARPTGWQLLSF